MVRVGNISLLFHKDYVNLNNIELNDFNDFVPFSKENFMSTPDRITVKRRKVLN